MARTVIGLFDRAEEAHKTVQDLERAGFARADISVVAAGKRDKAVVDKGGHKGDRAATGAATGAVGGGVLGGTVGLLAGLGALTIPGIGPILAAGPLVATLAGAGVGAAGGAVAGGLIGALTDVGVPEEEAEFYAEGLRRGGTLVSITTDEAKAHRAAEIMQRHGAIDVDERSRQYGMPLGGAAATTTTRQTTTRTTPSAAPGRKAGEVREQIVEEQLQVGKREAERGGVRIYSRITERPVEEQVRLREERVHVERRPADRPASEADLRAGREEIIINERVEEPVVGKRARVVGEVVVSKEAQEHTETVRDKVRRKDVEVERLSGAAGSAAHGFDRFEPEFRTHYQTAFGRAGMSYDQVSPAYRYGYEIGGDQRYKGREWDGVRTQARSDWESRSPGTWDKVESAVRHGWEKMRGHT